MNTLRKLTTTTVAAVCLLTFTGPAPVLAEHLEDTPENYGRKMARSCGGSGLYWIKGMDQVAAHHGEASPAQKKAWEKLRDTARAAREDIQAACDKMRDKRRDAPAPEQLAMMTEMSEAQLAAMRKIAPAFEAFYNTLNADQKEGVDDNMFRPRMRQQHQQMPQGMHPGMPGGYPPHMQNGPFGPNGPWDWQNDDF
ncbi:MAG: Spy/CpxP family protein refolding chaperone [Nitrospirota bacterium]|nr:Spy/CpxP family protein refolding chaperone [Nitrospirota bacterium]